MNRPLPRAEWASFMEATEPGLAIAGSMHLRSAIMAARDAGRRHEAWDHLALAQDRAQRIGRDTNHYGLVFGPSNVRIHEVAAAIELDDADEADEAIRRNEDFMPPPDLPPERSSHHHIDVARAYLAAGRREETLDSLLKAERLAAQHTRYHPMARETVTALIRIHARVPEQLRRLAGRIRLTMTPPTV